MPNQQEPNTQSQLPLENGTSASAPSTSASSPVKTTPQQKVSQDILNTVVKKHTAGLTDDQLGTFFFNLEKSGYSRAQIDLAYQSIKPKEKVFNSKVLQDKMKSDLEQNSSPAYVHSYINELVKKGYKEDDLYDFANKIPSVKENVFDPEERVRREKVQELTERNAKVIYDEKGQPYEPLYVSLGLDKVGFGGKYDPIMPIADWGYDFSHKTVNAIGQGGELFNQGLQTMLNATQETMPSGESRAGTFTKGALQSTTGGAQAAFNIIPAAITFNAGMDAINTTAKKNLSTDDAKFVEDVTALPFTIASKTANALGFTPEEGSNSAMVLELMNLAIAGKAMHSISTGEVPFAEKMKSLEDLKEMSKKAAENKLTTDEKVEFKKYSENLASVNLADIKAQAEKSTAPEAKEILAKIDDVLSKSKADATQKYLAVPNEEIINTAKEGETPATLRAKADEIDKNLEAGLEVNYTTTKDQAGNEYYFATDTKSGVQTPITAEEYAKQTQILEQQKQQLTDQSAQLRKTADAMDVHDIVANNPQGAIDEINANADLTPEQKQQAVEKITNSSEMDFAIKKVEDAKVQHIRDIHAVANPGSSEFYDLAESALSDESVLPRVKASLEEAATAGEITPEEAQAQLDAFKERIPIQENMNPAIKVHPEIAMKVADLAKELKAKEEDLRKVKSYIGEEPEITIQNKERGIENTKKKIADLLAEAKEKTKAETTEPPVAEPPAGIEEASPETPEEKTHAIWKRVLGNLKDEELKTGLEQEGVNYLVKKDAISESSARDLVNAAKEAGTMAELEKVVLDDSNTMDPVTRGVTSAMLGKEYFDLSEVETDPVKKEQHLKEFFKYTDKAASLATEGGQMGNAIGKVIKKMYANNPETIISKVNEHLRKGNEEALAGKEEQITQTYDSIKKILETPEGQAAVTEQIAKQSERLFGKETQKKITDLFDKAKIDTKGKVFDASIGLPVAVYNGAVEAMKQAALLGAKGADIIAEGVRHIRENHKEEWDDAVFKKQWEKDLKDSGVKFGKKRSVTPKEEASILDAIEKKAGRLKKENRDKFLKDIVQEVEKEGGLSEQRFKDLYTEALGLKTMTPELVETIRGYSKIINEGTNAENAYLKALDDIIDAQRNGADEATIKKLKETKAEAVKNMVVASLKAKKANEALSQIMKENKKLSDTLIGMMQLGALTPGSLIKNITAMPAELAFRALSGHIQGAADYLLTGLANVGLAPESWKERKVDSFARTQGAWYAHPKAFKKFYDTILHGSFAEDFTSRELHNKIEPVQAFKNIVSGKTKGDMNALAANMLEALPQGYLAAGMGRALAGPDAFFRTIGEQSKAYELGTMKGLEGAELEKYMAEPPKADMEKIQRAGDEITFQQDSRVSEMIKGGIAAAKRFSEKMEGEDKNRISKAMTGALKVIGKSQALYVKTPINVFGSVVRMISPEYSVLKAIGSLTKGDKEAFSKHMADVAVGYGLRYVIVNAIKHNMITPTVDYKSKEGAAQSDLSIKHGGKFNRSAFNRMITGGDWKEQPDDIWVDYSKWTGGLGIAVGAYASMLDGVPKEDMNQMTMVQNSYKVLPTMMQQVMDLSFMSTTAMAVDAMRENDGSSKKQKWFVSTVGTLATPLFPNTVTTAIKASSDTKKEIRSKDWLENIKNDFSYKLTGGSELPSKINLWGEPIATAPKGENKYMYYLFNVAKPEDPDEKSVGYKIMELYRKSGDKRVVPTAPSNQITIGKEKVTLDGFQFEQLQKNIGTMRKKLANEYLSEDAYQTDDDDKKGYKLEKIYGEAHKMGVEMLVNSDEHLTSIKNNGSSTTPVTGNKKPRPKREGGGSEKKRPTR